MTRVITGIILFSLFFYACKTGTKHTLVGTWRAVKLENAEMDSFFIKSQAFIDTMGKNNDDATNMQVYGVTNMDSMRKVLQQQYDSAKTIQANTVLNTVFKFRKDSVAILIFNDNMDSARWYMDGSKLVLDDLNKETQGQKLNMEILSLTDTVLKLRFEENGASSTVTFHPEGK